MRMGLFQAFHLILSIFISATPLHTHSKRIKIKQHISFQLPLKIKRQDSVKTIACSTCTFWLFAVKKIWCSSPKMKKFLPDLIGITIINQSNL